ncbi:MAG TPA: ribose-5-phosphate isomerase RpiA [Vicinamibacteria bacterium]|nr:ribose-5-phosphate isomerase RpiA [Vicinamibacteria bacterium]
MLVLPVETEKSPLWSAAVEAAEMVESRWVVGLGTGRAASMFVHGLARRVRGGLSVRSVATSRATESLARELEIPMASLDEVDSIDIDVDGADEVAPNLDLIKGHGGALVRERVVASISRRFVVLVGDEKLVPRLGARGAVPVEVVPFAVSTVFRGLERLGATVSIRSNGDGRPFASDNGNAILDASFDGIDDPSELSSRIDSLAGVVDNGLFLGMADLVLVQSADSFRRLERA